jgi:hypothetical protein
MRCWDAPAQPAEAGTDFIEDLNPNSLKVISAFVEPSLASTKADDKFQIERLSGMGTLWRTGWKIGLRSRC